MNCIGYDKNHKLKILSNTLEEYYAGVAKQYADISRISLKYNESDRPIELADGTLHGDFALLRAILQDHERALFVSMDNGEDIRASLYFPDYLYGFVEDTFARAIHHKIEGSGYACRECVGKYELRLREYDRLFSRVYDQDNKAAVWMALCRLRHPLMLADSHRQSYEDYIRVHDSKVMSCLMSQERDISPETDFLIKRGLLSERAATEALKSLSETKDAQTVALLIRFTSKRQRRLSL